MVFPWGTPKKQYSYGKNIYKNNVKCFYTTNKLNSNIKNAYEDSTD